MSNFIKEFKKGQSGEGKGLYMGDGLKRLDSILNGVQKGRVYTIASAPKVGKTTLVDYAFVINPYLYSLKKGLSVKFIYLSFEISRIEKEFDFVSYFLKHDYGITEVELFGETKDGSYYLPISSYYLRGRVQNDHGEVIRVSEDMKEKVREIYYNRIVPIFGQYDEFGNKLSDGILDLYTSKKTPTEYRDIIYTLGEVYKKQIAYCTENGLPDTHYIVIVDHVRKFKQEGLGLKQTIDKWSDYCIELKTEFNFSFVNIIHTNRNVASSERIKFMKGNVFPQSEDIKDSGNLSEDSDYVISMFNPNDEKYNLKKHFNLYIKDENGYDLYPNLRTLHLIESRHCTYPLHFKVNMLGNQKDFEMFITN